ncbi:MAG: hypothetical protein AB1792_11115 [Candidatus Zixiibacteriota bacterium]
MIVPEAAPVPTVDRALRGATDKTPAPSAEENWQTLRTLLRERIRRRWLALSRLSPEAYPGEVLEARLSAIADDGMALWRCAEGLDRALDVAFAPRACRCGRDITPAKTTPAPHSDEFKVR